MHYDTQWPVFGINFPGPTEFDVRGDYSTSDFFSWPLNFHLAFGLHLPILVARDFLQCSLNDTTKNSPEYFPFDLSAFALGVGGADDGFGWTGRCRLGQALIVVHVRGGSVHFAHARIDAGHVNGYGVGVVVAVQLWRCDIRLQLCFP